MLKALQSEIMGLFIVDIHTLYMNVLHAKQGKNGIH